MSDPQYPSNDPNQPPFGYPGQPPYGYQPPGPNPYNGQPFGYPPPPPNAYPPNYGYPGQSPFGYQFYGNGPFDAATAPKATFGQRLGSTLLDWLVMIPVFCILSVGVGIYLFGKAASVGVYSNQINYTNDYTFSSLLGLIFSLPYYIYQIILVARGQTLGNRAAGMKLFDSNGSAPGFTKAIIRVAAQSSLNIVSSFADNLALTYIVWIITIFGYLWMLWDPYRQTLYDKIADVYAINVRPR